MVNKNEDEISFNGILSYLKSSISNVVSATAVCLLIGFTYYFSTPKMYEASATIRVAKVAGIILETPLLLLEKVKSPLFFSDSTSQVCGSEINFNKHFKYEDKLKLTLNKYAPVIDITFRSPSAVKAKECLKVVISDIQKHQNEIFYPLVNEKEGVLVDLKYKLQISEEIFKDLKAIKRQIDNDQNLTLKILAKNIIWVYNQDLIDLRQKISSRKNELLEPKTQASSLTAPIYSSELPINKRPLVTFVLSVSLGIFLGLLVTGFKQVISRDSVAISRDQA